MTPSRTVKKKMNENIQNLYQKFTYRKPKEMHMSKQISPKSAKKILVQNMSPYSQIGEQDQSSFTMRGGAFAFHTPLLLKGDNNPDSNRSSSRLMSPHLSVLSPKSNKASRQQLYSLKKNNTVNKSAQRGSSKDKQTFNYLS